jgi:predicted RNase H-like HicB family nuclease
LEAPVVTQFTAVFRQDGEGYLGFIEELPGANTQGTTLEETRVRLREAVALVLAANRALGSELLMGTEITREPLLLPAVPL